MFRPRPRPRPRPVARPLALRLMLVVAGFALACDRPAERREAKERALTAQVLGGLLAYPHSSIVAVSTGQNAAQATLSVAASPEDVATWYRQVLRLNGWVLERDAVGDDGSVTIYAVKDKRPVWITVRSDGAHGTSYTLIGAELPRDSTGGQRSGSSMSSKRIQRR